MAPALSLRAYARHRRNKQLPGGTLRAVAEAVAGGRIDLTPGGAIADAAVADRTWEERTDSAKRAAATNGHTRGAGTLQEARRLEALERGRGLRLQNDLRAGELIEARVVERHMATLVLAAKNKIRGVPSRLKARIPHLSIAELAIVSELLDEALTELADDR